MQIIDVSINQPKKAGDCACPDGAKVITVSKTTKKGSDCACPDGAKVILAAKVERKIQDCACPDGAKVILTNKVERKINDCACPDGAKANKKVKTNKANVVNTPRVKVSMVGLPAYL